MNPEEHQQFMRDLYDASQPKRCPLCIEKQDKIERLRAALGRIAPIYGDCMASDWPDPKLNLQIASEIAERALRGEGGQNDR